jgi:hypothetical protein
MTATIWCCNTRAWKNRDDKACKLCNVYACNAHISIASLVPPLFLAKD